MAASRPQNHCPLLCGAAYAGPLLAVLRGASCDEWRATIWLSLAELLTTFWLSRVELLSTLWRAASEEGPHGHALGKPSCQEAHAVAREFAEKTAHE